MHAGGQSGLPHAAPSQRAGRMGVCAAPPTAKTQGGAGIDARGLFVKPGVPLFGQPFELVILLIDAISDTRLVSFA
jgi:hypothetical protein